MSYVISAIRTRYIRLKIRYKFLVTYFMLLMIPLFLVGMVYYQYFIRTIEQQSSRFALQTLKQTELHIDYMFKEIEALGSVFFSNVDINDMLRERYSDYEDVDDYKKLLNQIDIIKSNAQVFNVRLYVNDDKLYARDNKNIFPLSGLANDTYYQELKSRPECTSFWTESHIVVSENGAGNRVLSFVIVARDYSNIRQIIGCLYIDILESNIERVLGQINFGGKNHLFLFNDHLKMVTSTGTDHMEDELKNIVIQHLNEDENSLQDSYKVLEAGGEKQFVVFSYMERLGWTIVNAVPNSEMFYETNAIVNNSALLLFLIAVFGALIAMWLSNAITRKIVLLTNRIRAAYYSNEYAGAAAGEEKEISDEITLLSVNYESMMQRINQLIRENYEVQVARKEEQLKALQAQINPHFLYNIFDMINWMAIRSNAKNISETIGMIADFYRIGLSDGREILPLCEEFRHSELYIELQKKRLYFESQMILPADLEYCPVIKLIVQPIVENAIIHGIAQRPERSGRLIIEARREENGVVILVCDNAAAIDLERVRAILDRAGNTSGAYGLKNVDERIKLHFGEKYGLQYRKAIRTDGTVWTVAEINIPFSSL